jgi:hypothetical protein
MTAGSSRNTDGRSPPAGTIAAEARWRRLYVQTLDETGRYGLCQWALDDGNPGACANRTADVYCAKHNRELERELQRNRKEGA